MNKKLTVSLCFLFLIAIYSGYCLWQIDRHEKAILGQEWLNPVPVMSWHKYLREKEEFDNLAKSYTNNNQSIISLVKEYQNRNAHSDLDEILASLPPAKNEHPNLDDMLEHIQYGINIPDQLFLPKSKQLLFKQEHPSEFNTWQAIIDDLSKHQYETPHPSNPPYLVIRQSISSYYRYMIIGDIILVIGLVVFLITYKEKSANKNM